MLKFKVKVKVKRTVNHAVTLERGDVITNAVNDSFVVLGNAKNTLTVIPPDYYDFDTNLPKSPKAAFNTIAFNTYVVKDGKACSVGHDDYGFAYASVWEDVESDEFVELNPGDTFEMNWNNEIIKSTTTFVGYHAGAPVVYTSGRYYVGKPTSPNGVTEFSSEQSIWNIYATNVKVE